MTSGTYLDVPQGSAVWFENRIGKLTASAMPRAMDRLKSGPPSKDCRDLMWEIVAERLTNIPSPHYVTPAMQWGKDHEDVAKRRYTEITGREVRPGGLFDHPSIDLLAASPDGLIGDDGLIETKCPTTRTHLQWLQMPECPPDYHWQMLVQLACSGRRWVDFMTFDPRMPVKLQHRIWRFEPTAERIEEAEAAAREFLAGVDAMFDKISTQGETA